MKMLPVQLSLNPPLGLWSDVLWRCPPAPPSQLAELKTQLPTSLPSDPKLWGREDVTVFLRFCEREFDLPKVDHELFQMNGKALCLLTRADFGHRCPGAGDVLHNVLQMLIIESHMMQWHLPNSPVTPTSRYPLSPHSHPPTPTWPPIGPPESPFNNPHMHHFMAPNSVTLSPPPSVDSQASSPPQSHEQNGAASNSSLSNTGGGGNSSSSSSTGSSASVPSISNMYNQNNTTSNSSNHSDSDEEGYTDGATTTTTNGVYPRSNSAAAAAAAAAVVAQYKSSPPTTPILKDMPQSISQQITSKFVNSWTQQNQQQQCQKFSTGNGNIGNGNGGSVSAPTTPSYTMPIKREFFPENPEPNSKCMPLKREFFPENTEPNTNGRLLWDFLQQLLNDRNQKYSDLIAWKCRDTGVFKIVDPAGLAKLWGIQKNHLSMNYDKMSRALRYYYRVNILRKVQGERHCYQFLRNPTELKNIKNISLLRQTINNSTACNTNGGNAGGGGGSNNVGVNSNSNSGSSGASTQQNNQSMLSSANVNSTNWSLNHQNMSAAAAAVTMQQQQQQSVTSSPQSPHRPSSRSNNHQHHHHHHGLPAISTSAAAAAVAAAAAAAYGPPPTSPLFMHAINGAFHYLSSGQPPNSPVLPATPSEKLQFHGLNLESNGYEITEEMKPTDLSVAGSTEKRPYSSQSASEECYPLIRNADGLTTIKLIRYNDAAAESTSSQLNEQQHQQQPPASPNAVETAIGAAADDKQQSTSMENEDNENSNHFGQETMPTDLRK